MDDDKQKSKVSKIIQKKTTTKMDEDWGWGWVYSQNLHTFQELYTPKNYKIIQTNPQNEQMELNVFNINTLVYTFTLK